MARRTDVKGDKAFWTAGIVVVIFTGREQLNVQKKKKVNDDQNEKKKKIVYLMEVQKTLCCCRVHFSASKGI